MKKKSKDFLSEISLEEEEEFIPILSPMEKDKKELKELINKSSSMNLSICLMKICQENNYKPLSIESYYEKVFSQMDGIKRTSGKKYKSKSISAIRAAIISNNLFTKNKKNNNLYSLNIKECIKYLKAINKNKSANNKITNLDISDINKENTKEFLGKKRKNSFDFSGNKIKRYKHVYELLENMMDIYTKDKDLNKKIKIYFNKCNNYKDVINKYKNNKNIIEGMLSTFNYFKPFLKNCLFNLDSITYLNNLNTKINEFKDELALSKNFFQ
jgi:hypothetical protein